MAASRMGNQDPATDIKAELQSNQGAQQVVAASVVSRMFTAVTSNITWAWNKFMPAVISGNAYPQLQRIKGHPVYGSLNDFGVNSFAAKVKELAYAANQHESGKCYFWLGHKRAIFLTRPEDIRQVFVKHQRLLEREGVLVAFSHVYNVNKSNLLVISSHNQAKGASFWSAKRKVLEKAIFEKNALKKLASSVRAVLDDQLKDLDKSEIDLREKFTQVTMAVIDRVLFKVDGDEKSTAKLSAAYDAVFKVIADPTTSIHIKIKEFLAKIGIKKEVVTDRLRKELDELVGQHLNLKDEKNIDAHKDNLIAALLKSIKQNVTVENVIEESKFILLGGHETTARLFQFALMSLARNPEVLKKLKLEIDAVQPDDKGEYDLDKMCYLDKVIKETLRLYPPAPALAREVTEGFTLEEKDSSKSIYINAGSIVMFAPLYTQRFAPAFKDHKPEEFNPDRFKDNEPDPAGYVPFGVGERHCPGQRLSTYLEARLGLIKIIKEYDFEMDSKIQQPFRLDILGTLRCVDQVKMKFTRRVSKTLDEKMIKQLKP